MRLLPQLCRDHEDISRWCEYGGRRAGEEKTDVQRSSPVAGLTTQNLRNHSFDNLVK